MILNEAHWHTIEHSGFVGDIPLWISMAEDYGEGKVCELGAGTGRVTSALSAEGFQVLAIDSKPALLSCLRASVPPGSHVSTLSSRFEDLADDSLSDYPLIIAPLLLVNLYSASHDISSFFAHIRRACGPTTVLGVASVGLLNPFSASDEPVGETHGSFIESLVPDSSGAFLLSRTRIDQQLRSSVSSDRLVPIPPDALTAAAAGHFECLSTSVLAQSAMTAPMDICVFHAR